MNDKDHVDAPCDCPANMPTQQCIRYCTGECDGPSDAPANGTPSELESEFRDGVPSTVETVSDYLKRFYPEYYVQIITNINRERGSEVTAHLLTSKAIPCELHCAFIWSRSPEGHEFWKVVAQREAS